jgi:CDP-paratose 2-epimerase
MKILITGGCGFIGTNIALLAREKGHEVIAFDSLIRPGTESNVSVLKAVGVEVVRGDVRNPEDFERVEDIDAIIHLAGNPGIPWSIEWPLYDFNVNTVGTLNVLEYSRHHGKIPVIFASTNKTYSDIINEVPLTEKDTRYVWNESSFGMKTAYPYQNPHSPLILLKEGFSPVHGLNEYFPTEGFGTYPHSPYGKSKLAADHYCQEYFHTYGVPTVVNRMSCIYGYYQQGVEDQGWIDWFVRSLQLGDGQINLYGDGKQVRDMLWGEDVAELYLTELEQIEITQGQVFNIGGSAKNTCSLNEAISVIEKETGKKAQITYGDWRHADQKIYISDTRKITYLTGWEQKTSPEEGIKKMIKAYANGKYEN